MLPVAMPGLATGLALVLTVGTALAADADHALRRMLRDVRVAVPNSIRTPATNCFELVPTSAGGRYRMAADSVNAGSAPVDPAAMMGH